MTEITDIEDYTNSKLINENTIKLFVKELIKDIGSPNQSVTIRNIELAITKLRQKYKLQPSKSQMRYVYDKYFFDQQLNNTLGRYLIKKACRSRSGVLVSTIELRPDVFSCPIDDYNNHCTNDMCDGQVFCSTCNQCPICYTCPDLFI